MKLTFFGAAHAVTGSCHCLEVGGKKILIDCGLQQGRDEHDDNALDFAPSYIDYVIVTHAHIDHSGRIPLLVKEGFGGEIYATRLTAQLLSIMLRDSAFIQESDAQWQNQKGRRAGRPEVEPLYTVADAEAAMQQVVTAEYGQMVDLCEGVQIRFRDAGHLLGSSMVEIWATENGVTKKLVFSGDLGNIDQPIIRDPEYLDTADYVVMESTYGDRSHGPRPDYVPALAAVLKDTFDRGGNLVIPSFAVGRTQEMLYFLRQIKEQNLVKGHENFTVYVDSPMAVEATQVFKTSWAECYDEEARTLVMQGVNPINFRGLKLSLSSDDSKAINFDPEPKVILSASGMCEAGRIRHHLKHNLWRPESTVLFVGYQSPGTLGRALVEGAKEVKLFGETIEVRCKVQVLAGVSGHADNEGLMNWVKNFESKPRTVFVTHGEDEVCDIFANRLRSELGLAAAAPYNGAEYDLLTGSCLVVGNTQRIAKEEGGGKKRENPVFRRLLDAGHRLLNIIKAKEGHTNKELARFASQVEALCDKWQD